MKARFCSKLPDVWPAGAPSWMPEPPEPYSAERYAEISRYELELARQLAAKPKRLAHSLSVGLTAERLAAAYDVDPYLARVAGILHDWSKAMGHDETIERARALGIDLGVELELVEPLLHGMIAARELPKLFGELPDAVWQAIDRHTLGASDMSGLDMVLFVADGIEPRRKAVPAIQRQRKMVGSATLEDLFLASFSDGIDYVIDTRRYLYPGTLAIYNDIVLARSKAASEGD